VEIIAAVRRIEAERRASREGIGRLLAELYGRGGRSWPQIARDTGLPLSTAYTLAKPYLLPDPGAET